MNIDGCLFYIGLYFLISCGKRLGCKGDDSCFLACTSQCRDVVISKLGTEMAMNATTQDV